jgi:predicted transcriptional regulator
MPAAQSLTRPLPELELQVMKALWMRGRATVADIQEHLRPRRPLAYTTVMTVMDRLARKGAVSRVKQGRGYLYRPTVSRSDAQEIALERLLNDFFNNSTEELARHLLHGDSDSRALQYNAPSPAQLDSALL